MIEISGLHPESFVENIGHIGPLEQFPCEDNSDVKYFFMFWPFCLILAIRVLRYLQKNVSSYIIIFSIYHISTITNPHEINDIHFIEKPNPQRQPSH